MSTETASRFFWVVVAIAAAAIIATGAMLTKAIGHDWYPMECCHQQDCAPVDKVEQIPTAHLANTFVGADRVPSLMMVTTVHGTVVVPSDFKPRQSPDGRAHACMMRSPVTGQMRLICLFLPPDS